WSSWTTPVKLSWIWWGGDAPLLINPKICDNSPKIREIITHKMGVIGAQLNSWRTHLASEGKEYLFAGVDVGWENGIEDYQGYDWPVPTSELFNEGYCVLKNFGYTASAPPGDMDGSIAAAVQDYVAFNAQSLYQTGVPRSKIYTHAVGGVTLGIG